MSWTDDEQDRLNRLRARELAGKLTAPEREELSALMAKVEAEEALLLAPEMSRLHIEASAVERELTRIEGSNEELAQLLAQQQALIADGQRFLADFDKRRGVILDGLSRIVGQPLPTT